MRITCCDALNVGRLFQKDQLAAHFVPRPAEEAKNDAAKNDGRYQCNVCKLYLPTTCSLRAHRRLHYMQSPLICPECGLSFSGLSTGELDASPMERFCEHLYYECLHVARRTSFPCDRCPNLYHLTISDLKRHYMKKMDQYYKCHLCPMAFKLQDTFMKHFSDTHNLLGKKPDRYFKVIFRCHCCVQSHRRSVCVGIALPTAP